MSRDNDSFPSHHENVRSKDNYLKSVFNYMIVLVEIEMNKGWNINFHQNIPSDIEHTYSNK